MATGTVDETGVPQNTRRRMLDTAVTLFGRYSFAGTSLQMIADELGFTKAAIYHHFRTREQLLDAVVGPILEQLRDIVATAETQRTPHARAEYLISGFAQLAVDNRVVSVLAADPSVAEILANAARVRPAPRLNGVLVQPMVPAGVEVMIGARIDPLFGPLLAR